MRTFTLTIGVILLALAGCGIHKDTSPLNSTSAVADYYTCVMHPSVHKDKPGACPVCGMTLVKRSASLQELSRDTTAIDSVALSPRRRVLANVETVAIRRETLRKEIDAVGVIDFAEPNLRHITMRFSGRLERLFLEYTGQKIRRGDPVALVYSPEAISAQEEFILALKSADAAREADSTAASDPVLLTAQSKEKLLELGFSPNQIEQLKKTRKAENLVTIVSPITGTVIKKYVDPQHYASTGEVIYDVADLSTVWMYADVYEQDIRFVKPGQFVDIATEAYPDEFFSGRVKFIEPVMNSDTRTIRIRTEFINQEGKLKPQMFVTVQFYYVVPEALVVPASAVLMTGKRNIVWVEIRPNVFQPREVEIGTTADSYVEIVSGLREGESVATSGGFLIDSESALDNPSGRNVSVDHSAPGQGK